MIVYCRIHGRSIGAVWRASGGFPSFETRHPRWRDHFWTALELESDHDRSNEFTNLRETTRAEVDAWCRDCGRRPMGVAVLVAAFEGGRDKFAQ